MEEYYNSSCILNIRITYIEKLRRLLLKLRRLFTQRSVSEEEAHSLDSCLTLTEQRGDLGAEFWTTLIRKDKRTAERILREYMHNQLPGIDNAAERSKYREWRYFFLKWPDVRLYGSHGWTLEGIGTLRDAQTTSRILYGHTRTVNTIDEYSMQTTCKSAEASSQTAGPAKSHVLKGNLLTETSPSASSSSSSSSSSLPMNSTCRMHSSTSQQPSLEPPSHPLFLSLPAELRNNIYEFLMPEYSNIDEIKGFIQSCRQIWVELPSMLVKRAAAVLRSAEQKSFTLHTSYCGDTGTRPPPSVAATPFIILPSVTRYTQIRNVNVAIPITYGYTGSPGRRPGRRHTFNDAFVDLRGLLALHLTFVTIRVPVQFAATVVSWDGRVRHRLLSMAQRSFKSACQTGKVSVDHVIFDYSHKWIGPFLEPGHRPYIAFVRQAMRSCKVRGVERKLSKARHVLLGHDPAIEGLLRVEDFVGDEVLGDEVAMARVLRYEMIKKAEVERKAREMEKLEDIVRRSRKRDGGAARRVVKR
jgi:hypothetical protein